MDVKEASFELHKLFNRLKRYSYPFELNDIPKNGIYICFDKNECLKGEKLNRVVRVGTHRTDGKLKRRIEKHFIKKRQRDSVFRNHIGQCLLNMEEKTYLKYWNLPFKKKEDKEKYWSMVDLEFEKKYENKITNYLKEYLSFVVIKDISIYKERRNFESALIATIAQDTISVPSPDWLGKKHPDCRINLGKLWNIHFLNGLTITEEQLQKIELCIND